MVTSVVESVARVGTYPELEGARVLITGLEAGHGVDIARAFAEAGCRLVVQTPDETHELEVVLEMLAAAAQEVRVSSEPITDETTALKFAQDAAKAFGGLDVVVNLARLDDDGLEPDASPEDVEDRVAATLGRPFRITHVVANRMQVTWKEGLILNIVTQRAPQTPAAAMLGSIARAALAGLTRKEAGKWADDAIRINAVVPGEAAAGAPAGLATEPEIASLALHLAGRRGRKMSGLVFDVSGPA